MGRAEEVAPVAEIVAALLRGGAAVDAVNSDGDTALMIAAYEGEAECCRMIVSELPTLESSGSRTDLTDSDDEDAGDGPMDVRAARHNAKAPAGRERKVRPSSMA